MTSTNNNVHENFFIVVLTVSASANEHLKTIGKEYEQSLKQFPTSLEVGMVNIGNHAIFRS